MTTTCLIRKPVQSNGVVDLAASRRLAAQIESHATALRSWAGILLTRLHSPQPCHEGTAQMLHDIAQHMEEEAALCGGLARKLGRNQWRG